MDLVYLDPPFNSSATYNVLFAKQDEEKAAAFFLGAPALGHIYSLSGNSDASLLGVRRTADLYRAPPCAVCLVSKLRYCLVRLVAVHPMWR